MHAAPNGRTEAPATSAQGGYLSITELATRWALRSPLRGRPFPGVRLRWSPCLDNCHGVAWGVRPPDGCPASAA
ncbi:DUF6302 family protein [Streptomyces laurentii]|uniref:DUF6302 family protein n=1 Tax=Streptomyces laurentii TaxID=39478 RepID=UPI0033FB54AA